LITTFCVYADSVVLKGWINFQPDRTGKYYITNEAREHCCYIPDDFGRRSPKIYDEWIYISAQSASGLGPKQYEEFVHPYNSRLAELYINKTVYYHGCECLDDKMDIIKKLPNLRRFHVSPWTSLEKAVEKFGQSVVLEVHSNPSKVFFTYTESDMKAELESFVKKAQGCHINLNLSDIQSINNDPEKLKKWAYIAQETANK
jgi:uroporphyrinogen-III decarboxylase